MKPFEPIDEQEYRVDYMEGAEARYLIGSIQFPDAGGVMVTRTRVAERTRIYLPIYVKIEEMTQSPRPVSERFR
jgi:hypothetical protein